MEIEDRKETCVFRFVCCLTILFLSLTALKQSNLKQTHISKDVYFVYNQEIVCVIMSHLINKKILVQ